MVRQGSEGHFCFKGEEMKTETHMFICRECSLLTPLGVEEKKVYRFAFNPFPKEGYGNWDGLCFDRETSDSFIVGETYQFKLVHIKKADRPE